jgi:hypothetical protein
MVWVSVADAAPYSALPGYRAVIVRTPGCNATVLRLAAPPVRSTVPSLAVRVVKMTLPGGDPVVEVTVAVKVTDCPKMEGFKEEVSATLLEIGITTWLTAADVLPATLTFPPYTAVIDRVPAFNVLVVRLATPAVNVALPKREVPLKNVTFPVGVAEAADTVAVKVTG